MLKTKQLTAEELAQMPDREERTELVKGELRTMAPAGRRHGIVAMKIGGRLLQFVEEHELGEVYAAETGFILTRSPDTVRGPDVAFVTAERAAQQPDEEGFFNGPPDLAVEVVSPNDKVEEVESKVLDYLRAGTQLIWIIHPQTKTITVYRSLQDIFVLTEEDVLEGGDLLPGFIVEVREIFA